MSGHNPHSRVSQPVNSSSWNHLQVPYARQPQLAHMSSDRTLRSSPLIWPNTNPADAFYNYMALTAAAAVANSNPKNTALDINPLLPFVRTSANAMPFNSVDLSLSSTSTSNANNRNSLTPSPRNQVSPGSGPLQNRFTKSSTDGGNDDSSNNGANKMDNNKLNTDPIAFLNEMSEQLASMRSNRNMTPSTTLPARDSNNLTSDLSNFRNNAGNDKPKQRNEPTELIREQTNTAAAAANLFENESLSQSVHLQQLLGLAPPVTSSITPNLNDLSKSLLSIFNNTSPTSSMLISPKTNASNFHTRQSNDNNTSKVNLNTSHDDHDSLDSQSCNGDDGTNKSQNTRYRRRKPQKTVRLSNELNSGSDTPSTEHEKIAHIKNDRKNDANNSNGCNFSSFHSDANSILPAANLSMQPPPQTQSMDLSHHCSSGGGVGASTDAFENGLVNYSKPNNLANLNVIGDRSDKDSLLHTDDMNNMNLFGTVNFGHLRGAANLTNDIATFPNTDDLVKKVEELVKCNEQNGFANNDFGPMELIKTSHANKLVSDAYENNRQPNGVSDPIKPSNNVEQMNNLPNTLKHNGNGIITGLMSNTTEMHDSKTHDTAQGISNDADAAATEAAKNASATVLTVSNSNTNSNQNGETNVSTTDSSSDKLFNSHNKVTSTNSHVLASDFAGMSSVDMMYEKMSNEVCNQPNFNASFANNSQNITANTPRNENPSSFNSNALAKEALSASSSESPSNRSTTSKKKTTTKKKANNRCNGKMNGKSMGKNAANQKNAAAKSKDKSDKKSDISEKKKTKSVDESGSESLNKFRGPYVHVERDGTLEVINAPLNEEIAEKQSKFKKNYICPRPADRNKVRGLHVSTLSNKYDAVTTDISWMCVFCKLGPHKYGLGDLFGPFILSTEGEDFQLAQIDPKDDVFKSHRNHLMAAAAKTMAKAAGNTGNTSAKKKRKFNQVDSDTTPNANTSAENTAQQTANVDIFHGMTLVTESSYEVWAHEDCIVWASGVHIIGARLVGLETAVWGSVRHQCDVCKQYGAMISCLQRSCKKEVHVPCAKRCDWHLDEQSFQSRCIEHSHITQLPIQENTNN